MAAPALAPGSATPPFMRAMGIAPVRWLISKLPPNQKGNESILRQIGHGATLDAGGFPDEFDEWYLALQKHTDTMEHDGGMISRMVTWRGFDPADSIPDSVFAGVETPTVFLWGEDDGFGGEEVARGVVGRMANAQLVMLPRFGHLPWLDDPVAIAEQTVGWLADAPSEQRSA